MKCYSSQKDEGACPIVIVSVAQYPAWQEQQSAAVKEWLRSTEFKAEAGFNRLFANAEGRLQFVLCIIKDKSDFWSIGSLPLALPQQLYYLKNDEQSEQNKAFAIAWGLGAYQYTRYKKAQREPAVLYVNENKNEIENIVSSLYLVRDLINTPTDDMGPSELAAVAEELAADCGAEFTQIVGEELKKQNFPAIYAVGRASDDEPRLLDIHWGDPSHPKVTLVGKGVCFDSGGLDIKPSSYMTLMKKDMGGSAHVLGLARMVMKANLPIRLRVLVPAVENVISGNAYKPGDIIKSRKGLTIEIGNTDAEGRVILADALTEAASENPALLIDISTLTGAARVAVGPEISAVFSNHDQTVEKLIERGDKVLDPIWRLPLFSPYREYLNSPIADINNNSSEPYAGAIVAALFLQEFVTESIPWLHFDIMAWNTRNRPGRPIGGEAMGLRALFAYLKERFA